MERRRKLLLFVLLLYKKLLLCLKSQRSGARRYWVHPVNQKRDVHGVYSHLVQEIRSFRNYHSRYLRMTVENFDRILALIRPHIVRQDTMMRKAVEPGLRLAITLHHLAEGASHSSISLHYRLGRSTVSNIIYDTCDAIWEVLQPLYLKAPSGPSDWRRIAKG